MTRTREEDGSFDDRVPYLARIESEERRALLALGKEMTFRPWAELLHEEEPTSHVLIILNGWTKVTVMAANSYMMLLALRGPGDIIGEAAGLTGRPRSATVTALEPVRAVIISHGDFREYLACFPRAALQLLALASDRTRAADRRSLKFASLRTRQRFAVLLLELARTHGEAGLYGIELSVPLSKLELAGSVGASREMVQRILKELRQRGIVETGRRSMVILRPDLLRRIAGVG